MATRYMLQPMQRCSTHGSLQGAQQIHLQQLAKQATGQRTASLSSNAFIVPCLQPGAAFFLSACLAVTAPDAAQAALHTMTGQHYMQLVYFWHHKDAVSRQNCSLSKVCLVKKQHARSRCLMQC